VTPGCGRQPRRFRPLASSSGCVGIDLHKLFGPEPSGDGAGRCLAHADGDLRAVALERLSRGSSLTFARGVAFSPALIRQLADAAPVAGGRPQLRDADFTSATLPSFAEFHAIDFTGNSSFLRTTFEGRAAFYDCRFLGGALFSNAVFHGEAAFSGVEFKHVAWFMETIFEGDAWFSGLTFPVDTSFRDAAFMKQARTHARSSVVPRRDPEPTASRPVDAAHRPPARPGAHRTRPACRARTPHQIALLLISRPAAYSIPGLPDPRALPRQERMVAPGG
jgi:Pentapeptide repeats (9 copies)